MFKTLFSSIKGFFTRLYNSTPKWSEEVSTGIKLAAPLTNSIVVLLAPEEAPLVQGVVSEVQSDLAVAAQLVSQSHGSDTVPAGVNTALDSVKNNLSGLLTAGHIKNADTLAKVTAVVNTIIGEVEAIIGALPKAAANA